MVRWPPNEHPVRDYGGPCPDVPPTDAWPSVGIAGTIGAGPLVGERVMAANVHLPGDRGELLYFLWLPEEELTAADGTTFLMESEVGDFVRTDGTGGLIDLLTRELSVSWSTDRAEAECVHEWFRSRPV